MSEGRRQVQFDPAVAAILNHGQEAEPRERRNDRSPHERERGSRRLGVTFPDAAWADAVRDLARRWKVRPTDVLVLAVARLMADLETGEIDGPLGPVGFQDRAGDVFELPWEP